MSSARAPRRMLGSWGVLLLLTGCVLPMPDGDSPSSSYYPGAGSGYSGAHGGDRVEYRGTLPSGTYTESCRDMRVDPIATASRPSAGGETAGGARPISTFASATGES